MKKIMPHFSASNDRPLGISTIPSDIDNPRGAGALVKTYLVFFLFVILGMTAGASAQTVNYGETSVSSTGYYDRNSNHGIYLEITTGTAAPYAVNSCSFYAYQQGEGYVECGIYTDNGGQPGSMLCHGSYTEVDNAPSGEITVPLSGCGTLSASTDYWVFTNTTDNNFYISISANCNYDCTGTYPSSDTPDWRSSSAVAYGTYPANPAVTEDPSAIRASQYITVAPSSSPQVAAPQSSPTASPYTSAQTVTLNDLTPGTTICYTTDGSDPTATTAGTCSHGTTYTGGLIVSNTTTVKAIGTEAGYANSTELTSSFTITPIAFVQDKECSGSGTSVTCAFSSPVAAGDALMIVVSPSVSTSPSAYAISVSDNLNGAWTQNGNTCFSGYNVEAATFYYLNSQAGNVTVTITSSTSTGIYSSIAEYSGIATSGAVDIPASCALTTSGATVDAPSVTTTYVNDLILASPALAGNGGFTSVASPYTLRGWQNGKMSLADQFVTSAGSYNGAVFTLQYGGSPTYGIIATYKAVGAPPQVATPVNFPGGGSYSSSQTVTLTNATSGATICYTTDGSDPAATTAGTCSHGTAYSGPVTVSSTTTLKAIGTEAGYANSPELSSTYTIQGTSAVSEPTITPSGGTYSSAQTITLNDQTSGAIVCYTTDGSDPAATTAGTCSHGTTYNGGFTVSSTTTVKAMGTEAGYTNSSELSSTYTIGPATVDEPLITPSGGSYTSAQTISLSDDTSEATICYTTDGSDPSATTAGTCSHGTAYSGGITISSTTTVKAIGTESGYANSAELSSTYTIGTIAFVQSSQCESTGTSVTCAFPSAVSAGDALMIFVSPTVPSASAYTISVSDSLNGAWTQNGSTCFSPWNAEAATFYYLNSQAGNVTVTITSSTSTAISSTIAEYSGIAASNAVDIPASCSPYAQDSSVVAPNVTTTNANDLIVASPVFADNGGSVSVSNPYSLRASAISRIPLADEFASSIGTYTGAAFAFEYGPAAFGMTATYMAVGSIPQVIVSVSPTSATLAAGQTEQFTASVAHTSNTGVTWTISPAGSGTISSSGFYTAPAPISEPQTVTVTATSQADPTKSASATVTLTTMTAVAVPTSTPAGKSYTAPQYVTLGDLTPGSTICYTTDGSDPQASSAGSCSHGTTYTGGFGATNTTVKAIGTEAGYANSEEMVSVYTFGPITYVQGQDCQSSGTSVTCAYSSSVAAGDALMIMVSPGSAGGSADTFSVSDNLNGAWTQNGSTCFSANTSEAAMFYYLNSKAGNVTVTVTSSRSAAIESSIVEYSGIAASNAVDVPASCAPAAGNTITAPSITTTNADDLILAGVSTQINGDDLSVSSPYSLLESTLCDAPLADQPVSSVGTYAGAVFTLDYGGSSTYGITTAFKAALAGQIGVNVSPANAALYGTQTQQFTASVTNTSNTGVTWTISPSVGSIDDTGLYTAPSTIASQQTATVTATSQADSTKSASATVTLMPPISVSVNPTSATLYGGQTQQFAAMVINTNNTGVIWAISPTGTGAIDTSGNYTAPASIATPQTVTVTATSQANSGASASATVTLMPPIVVALSPATSTLMASQTQQFTASVTNTNDTAVSWSISPTGTGSISSSGLYTAPAAITSQQSVTITATSQANNTTVGTATVTLAPSQCASNGYSYKRQIVIDHTKVPNTDQSNFPFLFNTTDPTLASTANGGHVANPNGLDIIFSTDPNGQNLLNYEMEEYNAVTGQVIAWVNIPNLSHTADTVIYMSYGNPNISVSQQNPSAVWDSNYMGVWHVPNGTQLSLADSTSNGNNATNAGALPTAGEIDGGMQTNGNTYATIGTPASLANLAEGNATFSAWVNPSATGGGVIIGKDDNDVTAGWVLDLTPNNNVDFRSIYSSVDMDVQSSSSISVGVWSHVVVTLNGSPSQGGTATIYINGVPSGSGTGGLGTNADDSTQIAYLANARFGSAVSTALNGVADEFRVSNTIRSADWIATEYNNQSSPSTFYSLSSENFAITPSSVTLYESQTQQFLGTILNGCQTPLTWALNPSNVGSLTSNGLYTAPANITTQQTVTVTATSESNPSLSSSTTITLMPPVAVNLTPTSISISNGGQTQQFMASVANASDTSVTWTISPSGVGSIDSSGVYTAPASIATLQSVSVTATSQADSTKSASATITLVPPNLPAPICASNGYSFVRAIVIDHTKVQNTDQANFPFLFNTTDPSFATTANGGHVANVNGYDIMFSTDPAGQTQLNYEFEKYDPVTGQIIAWIEVPNLSHSSDTILYMFYGNDAISVSQQNPKAVWDSNYLGVWHVPNGTQLSLADSTSNANNGTNNGAIAAAGQIDGGMSTDGTTFATIGTPADLANLPQGNATFSAWVNISAGNDGAIMSKEDPNEVSGWMLGSSQNGIYFESNYSNGSVILRSTAPTGNGTWSYVVVTLAGSQTQGGQATVYINGQPSGTASGGSGPIVDDSGQPAFLGNVSWYWELRGRADEFRISNTIRSADWIATEYNNQGSPATFYQLYPENEQGTIPTSATLYASQSEQFNILSGCAAAAVTWSMPGGSPGTLTANGLYTAPASIATQQTITLTAASVADGSVVGTAAISLLPPVSISIDPTTATLQSSQTQQFTAIVSNTNSTNVTWSISPSDLGSISSTGLYTPPASIFSPETVTVTATNAYPNISASATITLNPTVTMAITPATGILQANQSEQFQVVGTATSYGCSGDCTSSGPVPGNWSINPAGMGSINSSGVYTAPANIGTQQTVIVTGSGQYDGVTGSATATITLIPNAPSIAIEPGTVTLTGGQSEQYAATVSNTSNTAVTWSISPAGFGTLSATGLYTAPPVVTSPQVITITAVSQTTPSLSATAVLTLSPTQCAAEAYSYVRSIVIDHTKIPNSDQIDFPFFFAITDPALASTANGGHVASSSGYDIEFSTDPAGLHALNYELEQYNPVTGQITAWIKIPTLSHSSDTVIYMFYGNSGITAPQQTASGVWDSNYAAVYQFDSLQSGSVPDITSMGNNAWNFSTQQAAGALGGAASFDGMQSLLVLPISDFASYPLSGASGSVFNASFGVWFKTQSSGVILGQTSSGSPGASPGGWIPALYIDTNGNLRASFFDLSNAEQIVSPSTYNDNNWHNAVLTFNTNATTNSYGGPTGSVGSVTSGVETLYVDGQVIASRSGAVPIGYSPAYSYFLGTGEAASWVLTNNNWFYFNGSLDQVEISSTARSADWVRTEYLNQSSPSTFFRLSAEAGGNPAVDPLSVTLYGSQSQQFTVISTGECAAGEAVWSMPAGSPGTLSSTGLYTAPEGIDTQQTVTLTATTLGASSAPLNTTVTLMPPIAISVTPGAAALPAGGTQQFTANVVNTNNTGVTWTLSPAGLGSISAAGLYTAPATVTSQQTVTVTAMSLADVTQLASATITLGTAAPAASAVNVSPLAATLYANQTQQFTATVTNIGNGPVTWSISPAGAGNIDSTGLYTAPATINSQATVTVTATSVTDPTVSGSATLILMASPCTSNGYSYSRAIVIDHTEVPNTDHTNFPLLFNASDSLFATTANGGHVTNANGYDIIFSTDPNGLTKLDHELEEYNPVTGQVIAWVRIPTLSHTMDTVIYMFYGNASVTTSQQNPTGVWDSNYVGVWHLPNSTVLSANDSTTNGNNGTIESGTSATAGEIDGGAVFNGTSTAYISLPAVSNAWNFTGDITLSAWVKTSATGMDVIQLQNGNPLGYLEVGPTTVGGSASKAVAYFRTDSGAVVIASGNITVSDGQWHNIQAVRNTGSSVLIYVDGLLDTTTPYTDPGPIDAPGAENIGGLSSTYNFNGVLDEVRVSNVARSADWIAAEYNNQSSPSTFYTLLVENGSGIEPASVTLYPFQSQQFAASGMCGAGVTWSLADGAPGTLSSTGIYTAPETITEQQTVTITATSQGNPNLTSTTTVTLMPPISVTVSPANATLTANQTQLFTSIVTNSADTTVTWSISPPGLGSIDQNGAYTAPSSIPAQQTVTITATSEADPTKAASAMVTLAPSQCASTGYGYQRVIIIDHTKVPSSDQINFPFLFNTTDPDLASVDNGGHVANLNGYDIIFSADPNGQTRLDFEVEKYNPATGQLIAWVRIPTLSHSSDTLIYLFYGNPAISISQANPTGVWDSNYEAVYHFGNLPSNNLADSTYNTNNAQFTSLTPYSGLIGGAASLDGVTSYFQIPSTAFPSYPTGVYSNLGVNTTWNNTSFSATFGIWFKTDSWGGLLDQTTGQTCTAVFGFCIQWFPEKPGDNPYGSWGNLLDINFNGNLESRGTGPSTQTYNDNKWHFAAISFENGVNKLYADGQLVATGSGATLGFAANYAYFVGTVDIETDDSSLDSRPWQYLNGDIDEVKVSNVARSGDWIQTEYNNQSSPSTFYKLYATSAIQVAPAAISLYAGQSEQFAVPSTCDASIAWSMPSGSPGTLSATGLYTAPESIANQQTATVTASSQASGTSLGSSTVVLLPAPQPITLTASNSSPYLTGSSETFTATLMDPQGNPRIGAAVNFTIAGANEGVGSATTDSNGNASYSYTGANTGTDTIQATASIEGALLTSNDITATWIVQPPAQTAIIALLSQQSLGRGGLVGAFTDNNGVVIEPIVVGTGLKTFITPAGASRLQLGINDNYYEDNGGSGFVVSVNGSSITIPPTTMPWNWKTGGLNNNYQYGVNDGTAPIIAAANLTAAEGVTVAYQSGTVSTDLPLRPLVDANGETNFITGTQLFQGAYFPTLYSTATSYPENQPITVFAVVTDANGNPIPNVSVTFNVSGANPGQYESTSDSTGTAVFVYSGANAGNDSLQAQATVAGLGTISSNLDAITWTYYPTPPAVGSLTLNYILSIVNQQSFSSYAKDAAGNPLPNVNVGFYVTGVDTFQTSSNTNDIGQSGFGYYHTESGNYRIIAVDSVGRNVIVTPPYTGNWVVPTGTPSASGGTISVGISANTYVTMPNALQLNGSATDSNGSTPPVTWTEVSGPGTVTFANPNQAVTSATFSETGTYVLQLFATDSVNSGWAQFTVTVVQASVAPESQGWIGAPTYGSAVSGIVPITLASGVSLGSGTLSYTPTNNPNGTVVLNGSVSGSGQIGTFDTTLLPNGPYWIQLQGTSTTGQQENSLVLVTVAGNFKPGRVTATVTDLVVPSTGLAINIQRTYDSLNANTIGDFGYGWNLGINVNLTVSPSGDVTFTLNGQRKTFRFAPVPIGFPFSYYQAAFTPEPGLYGTLTDSQQGCPLDLLLPDGSSWQCTSGGQYNPPGYIYTDPSGRQYTISASGGLQSILDKNGNALTITPNGITSSTGLNVPFVRDSQGRITQITDPQGNQYLYAYDENGNLNTVAYPVTTCSAGGAQPISYTYAANHYYTGGIDACNNPLPSTSYYGPTDTDVNGLPLNGRLESVKDALGETTSYVYDLDANKTTVTDPAEISVAPGSSGDVGTSIMVYDSYGDLTKSTDPLGNLTQNTYDANHNLISVTDPLGNITTYTYDSNGNQTSVTYPNPNSPTVTNTTSHTAYNQFSEPISTTDELGNKRIFNYDANYNPLNVTDSAGTLASFIFNPNGTLAAGAIGYDIASNPSMGSQFAYDANGDLVGRTDALGRTTSYTHNILGQKTSMTIPIPSGSSASAVTTSYTYDDLGNLVETDAPLGRTTKSQYDANGNKKYDIDPDGNKTAYTYDALNRLIRTDYPDGTYTHKTYDFRGNVVDEWDQAQNQTHHVYDLAGHETSVTRGVGSVNETTYYTYDADGRKTSEANPLGQTTYAYDAAGNLITVSGINGNFKYGYDNARNRISMTILMADGNNQTTNYQYDARKRLIQTTYPDLTTTINGYDGAGNLSSVKDQAGNIVRYTYDAANQLKSVIQAPDTGTNTTTNYVYDPDGNLTALTDANIHTTHNSYDLLYELTTKTLPDGGNTETRTYDTAGNLVSLKHFNGDTTTYGYDPLNRLSSRTPDPSLGEPTVSFTYTLTGKRASMTDASGTTTYNYDPLDRLKQKVTPEGTLNYTYDGAGNLQSMTSGDGNVSVSYTWNSLNQLGSVTDSHLGTTTYTYDNANNVVAAAYPNGVQATLSYDQLNRLTSLITSGTSNTGYLYQLGQAGNKIGANEYNGRSINWTYDGIYRLTNESISGDSKVNGSVSYGLDPVGNRLSETSVPTLNGLNPGSFSYNADDELSGESYDADGNTTATGGKSFAYDSQDRLKSMNGGAVTITYDGDGNRVAKTANGATTRYLIDDLNPTGYAQVVEETGTTQRVYTYGLQRIGEYQVINNAWTPSFYGYDGVGNVRTLTNSAGAITATYEYDAFGNELNSTGTTPSEFLYRGEQYDSDLGLYYLRARYMNPFTGRFLSRDPEDSSGSDPKTLHKYLYAEGDPVNATDPTGKQALAATATIDIDISIRSTVEAMTVAAGVTCILNTAADLLQGVTTNLGLPVESISIGACTAKVEKSKCTLGGSIGGVVIGEWQPRVVATATAMQAGYFKALPPEQTWMEQNKLWINEVMDQGCDIYDIGASPVRKNYPDPTSPFYRMEREQIMLRGYPTIETLPVGPVEPNPTP